ncbi:cysK [Symbiodinium microadriaticum]|nr:cysK [Symbiodinium microadriaticum]
MKPPTKRKPLAFFGYVLSGVLAFLSWGLCVVRQPPAWWKAGRARQRIGSMAEAELLSHIAVLLQPEEPIEELFRDFRVDQSEGWSRSILSPDLTVYGALQAEEAALFLEYDGYFRHLSPKGIAADSRKNKALLDFDPNGSHVLRIAHAHRGMELSCEMGEVVVDVWQLGHEASLIKALRQVAMFLLSQQGSALQPDLRARLHAFAETPGRRGMHAAVEFTERTVANHELEFDPVPLRELLQSQLALSPSQAEELFAECPALSRTRVSKNSWRKSESWDNRRIQIDDDHIPKALMFRAMFGSCVMALRPQLKYSSSVVLLQRQAKALPIVQLVFHLTRGEKGSKILPYVWKLGMLPIAKDGKYVSPEVWRLRQEMEKRKREKSLSKKKEPDEDEPKEPPRSIDLFSKVGMESLSDAAACVIQQTFYALQQAMGCAKTLVAEIVNTAGWLRGRDTSHRAEAPLRGPLPAAALATAAPSPPDVPAILASVYATAAENATPRGPPPPRPRITGTADRGFGRGRLYDNIVETVGNTPCVKLSDRICPAGRTIYAKLEYFNPLGSVKDRLACAIIEQAERDGTLKPGDTVIEATSGNTGIGLAMLCAQRGYRCVITMAEPFSVERRKLMRFLGAKVIITPKSGKGLGMVKKAQELAETHGWFLARQFEAKANAQFHYDTTGHEILNDFEGHRLDYYVQGFGTGGTFAGAGRALREKRPEVKICLAEPADAAMVASGIKTERKADGSAASTHPAFKPHPIQGWSPDFIAEVAEDGIQAVGYEEHVTIPGAGAIQMAHDLAKKEGIFTGISGGASIYAAVEMAKRAPEGSVLLAVIADTGERYLSTPLFSSVSVDMDEVRSFSASAVEDPDSLEEQVISKSTPSYQLS